MKVVRTICRNFSLFAIAGMVALMPLLPGCDVTESTTGSTTKTTFIPFAIHVSPLHMDDTIEGASYVFLVTVDYGTTEVETKTTKTTGNTDATGQTTDSTLAFISATAENATVTVGPKSIAEGYVAEVVVVPNEGTTGSTLTVTVKGEWNGYTDTETVTLNVREASGSLEELAAEAINIRNIFISWIATNCPDLGISLDEVWAGTIVYPNTVVIKYFLFFSEKWEVGIRWNTSTNSLDWAQMYLRLRTAQFAPSRSFEIASLSAASPDVYEISPPNTVWR
jgi:hypothetical protein